MKTIHFTSNNTTTIQNDAGVYTFQGTGKYDMLEHHTRLLKAIARKQREVVALAAFLNGESVSDPAALRF